MWDIADIGLAMLATDDMSGDEQNGLDRNGLPILLIPALETGEPYCSIVGDVLGDIGCLTGDFFGKLDEGDPMELDDEFFGDNVQASGGEDLLLN